MRRLVIVEAAFPWLEQDVAVLPDLPLTSAKPLADDAAELRCPDGSTRVVRLGVAVVHLNLRPDSPPPRRPYVYSCLLRGLEVDQVPVGSEIWARDDLVASILDRDPLV